jgi:hypothetical protein
MHQQTVAAYAARMNDRDLHEAWLLIPTDDVISPLDHAVIDEMDRRSVAQDGAARPVSDDFVLTPRLWNY